ncbi:hypothetical protein [Desulfurococcus amylolyticus]|uniref:Uncharacterized protein n=1 Tax=Desulfurococcus amylolyticus (strain DSM 18924 / JCM 16383 / VKM B-2413 / 1221n) TaxID=490899 RepID=B8D2T6_DESA1|nr:hypothetical protein [Desulfurococcus amylolyticus]ACL10483.1 hypothetical protein DKAM_0154 [Desulfurococcus amylolyticus 1221n]
MGFRHEESLIRELEFLRKASTRFLTQRYGLPRYIVEYRLNKAQLLFNLLRDYARWLRSSDECPQLSPRNEEGSTG